MSSHHQNTAKVCKKCGMRKEFIYFPMDKRRADGRENICKDCRNVARRNRALHNAQRERMLMRLAEQHSKNDHTIQNKVKQDEIQLMEALRKRYNAYFHVAFHPHIDGWVIRLDKPHYHREGKDLRSMLLEVLALSPAMECF